MDQLITKVCSKCKVEKSVDEFHKSKNQKDGFNGWCKDCTSEYKKTYVYKGIVQKVTTKICSTCKIEKAAYEFNKKKNSKDGLNCRCQDCYAEYQKQYIKKHIDQIKEYQKQYNKQNYNKLKEQRKQNADQIIEYQKQYNKQNYNKKRELGKKYRQANAVYTKFVERLSVYNKIKESEEGFILVQCKYCNAWIIPTNSQVQTRIQTCEGNVGGEAHFYCNDNCKHSCSSFYKQLYPRGFKQATSREVDPLLRQMCFERDNWTCIKCGATNKDSALHSHHIEGAVQSPMTANDIDNVITVCKSCHKEIHSKKGCNYSDFQREKCAA